MLHEVVHRSHSTALLTQKVRQSTVHSMTGNTGKIHRIIYIAVQLEIQVNISPHKCLKSSKIKTT